MKKVLIALCSFFLTFTLASCADTNTNSTLYDDEWYPALDPGSTNLVFHKDGALFSNDQEIGTYTVDQDSVIISSLDSEEKVTCYLNKIDGYTTLDMNGEIFVKGYDNAVAYYEEYLYIDPSDIWTYDFTGEYYKAYDERLSNLSQYEQMVEIKTSRGKGYTVNQQNGGFTLTDNYSGYSYGSRDYAVTVDIDRENRTMKHIDSYGYIDDEYRIEWCEETQEFYFVDDTFDTHWFRLSNVQ